VLHAGAVPDTTRPRAAPADAESIADAHRLRMLREEVGRLRQRETRRRFDACLHVGELGGQRTGLVIAARDLPVMDVELRVDLAARLLQDTPPLWRTAWLVRPGTPDQHDVDLQWFSAVRTACAMHGRPLDGCYVVTRSGWRDLLTGDSRTWVRLRL
jgi:hypothetical protein